MFYFIGIMQLLLLSIFMFKGYKKQGFSILGDSIKLMFILWLANIGLYNLQLSKLYNPNWQINIIVLLICLVFFVASKKIYLKEEDILANIEEIKGNKEDYYIYSIITTLIFIIASIVFWMNIKKYGLAIFSENKINKQQIDHYAGYIVYMLVLCAQFKYILFRTNKKIIDGIIFILSLGTLVLTLNRGPLSFIVLAIYIYELFNLVKIKKEISKKKLYAIYAILILTLIGFLQVFGYIGDMRMEYVLENVFNRTIQEHYQMSENLPSGFLWSYVYLTSPLENASFSLINQSVQFTYFSKLFYPFIKLGANLLGMGAGYKGWIMGREAYTPYLQKKVGLNASSFIPEAMQDLGYLGVIIYVAIFLALAYFGIALIKKKIKFSALGSMIIYVNILNILVWSVFVNSLKIPVLILNILIIIFIEFLRKKGVFKWLLKKIKKDKKILKEDSYE
ncbi:hypothetical protein [Clostridium gasigenes]|uniref:Oligosaccharide repeat unit polymerase n=1 Tax=Clostridium gasigenes TaxID=94869 RepID=A0A7X0VPQ7_9CLOT|nr:hypothetical protein [Clostridium gasigenes]MBB6713504.1 hypothetical protein [Clostridium gasigenes]